MFLLGQGKLLMHWSQSESSEEALRLLACGRMGGELFSGMEKIMGEGELGVGGRAGAKNPGGRFWLC